MDFNDLVLSSYDDDDDTGYVEILSLLHTIEAGEMISTEDKSDQRIPRKDLFSEGAHLSATQSSKRNESKKRIEFNKRADDEEYAEILRGIIESSSFTKESLLDTIESVQAVDIISTQSQSKSETTETGQAVMKAHATTQPTNASPLNSSLERNVLKRKRDLTGIEKNVMKTLTSPTNSTSERNVLKRKRDLKGVKQNVMKTLTSPPNSNLEKNISTSRKQGLTDAGQAIMKAHATTQPTHASAKKRTKIPLQNSWKELAIQQKARENHNKITADINDLKVKYDNLLHSINLNNTSCKKLTLSEKFDTLTFKLDLILAEMKKLHKADK